MPHRWPPHLRRARTRAAAGAGQPSLPRWLGCPGRCDSPRRWHPGNGLRRGRYPSCEAAATALRDDLRRRRARAVSALHRSSSDRDRGERAMQPPVRASAPPSHWSALAAFARTSPDLRRRAESAPHPASAATARRRRAGRGWVGEVGRGRCGCTLKAECRMQNEE